MIYLAQTNSAAVTTPAANASGEALLANSYSTDCFTFLIPSQTRGSVTIFGDFSRTDKVSCFKLLISSVSAGVKSDVPKTPLIIPKLSPQMAS